MNITVSRESDCESVYKLPLKKPNKLIHSLSEVIEKQRILMFKKLEPANVLTF